MPSVNNITKSFGDKIIFDNFSYNFERDKITVIIGKSGVGKTTLLNIIAGLCDYTGSIDGFGKISFVFQEPRLIPFLTVNENLLYSLSGVKMSVDDKQELIDKTLKLVDLYQLKHKVCDTLSGGEKQRVSLIRAFIYSGGDDKKTMLLDEPFSSLDIGIKYKIAKAFYDLYAHNSHTVIMVTHNVDEALYLADKIVFLGDDGIEQFDNLTPHADRHFGYETDTTLRSEILKLLL